MASGVSWSYLKGMPVFIGVVNKLESVMTITCGFPRANFTYKNASAPAPPALLTTRKFWEARLFFWRTAEMKRAIRSAPPPVPAGTTNSTGFVGCHRSEEHTSELQSPDHLVCRLLLEKK